MVEVPKDLLRSGRVVIGHKCIHVISSDVPTESTRVHPALQVLSESVIAEEVVKEKTLEVGICLRTPGVEIAQQYTSCIGLTCGTWATERDERIVDDLQAHCEFRAVQLCPNFNRLLVEDSRLNRQVVEGPSASDHIVHLEFPAVY